jgi:hypothetical protein
VICSLRPSEAVFQAKEGKGKDGSRFVLGPPGPDPLILLLPLPLPLPLPYSASPRRNPLGEADPSHQPNNAVTCGAV